MYSVFYGPVESWRFGRSLGVNPLERVEQRCPFSCIYCQYGETRRPTWRRRQFITAEQLRGELTTLRSSTVTFDCVTFAGLGEPTLAANLTELVTAIREQVTQPLVILTGGGLIFREDVRRDLALFDMVVIKLDAPDEGLFRQINRPGRGYPGSLTAIVEGIRQMRRTFSGRLALQMMFLKANLSAAKRMAELARELAPDEVQLNTPLEPALGGPLSSAEMRAVEREFAGLTVRSVYTSKDSGVDASLW